MKRTPLARKIAQLLRQADFLNRNQHVSPSQFLDFSESRRQFLKNSAAIGSGLILGPNLFSSCASKEMLDASISKNRSKVTILGAGMAGLVSAYHLTKARIPCEIYEASERVGGRVFTKENFNSEGMYCELGGELVDTNNVDITGLCHDFSIEIEPFAPFDKGLESNLYFFKNKLYTDRDLLPAFQKLAKHLQVAKNQPADKIDQISLEQFLTNITDVEAWVIDAIRVAWVGEAGVEAGEQSALMMVGTMDSDFSHGTKLFGDSDEAYKIRGGNSRLTSAIQKYLTLNGVEIHFGSPLISIKERSQKIEMRFAKNASTIEIKSDQVICSMPFSRLRDVDGIFDLALSPEKKTCIKNLKYGTNAKMMLGFKSRHWRTHSKPKSNGMVYTDLFDQNLWETSRLQEGTSGILTSFTGGKEGADLNGDMVPNYLKSMDHVFPGLEKIYDLNSAVFNWSKYPHSKGSYSVFGPGQITQFGDCAGQTELGGRLYFAGEHATKDFAGFINGAAFSGRRAAEKIISGQKS